MDYQGDEPAQRKTTDLEVIYACNRKATDYFGFKLNDFDGFIQHS